VCVCARAGVCVCTYIYICKDPECTSVLMDHLRHICHERIVSDLCCYMPLFAYVFVFLYVTPNSVSVTHEWTLERVG